MKQLPNYRKDVFTKITEWEIIHNLKKIQAKCGYKYLSFRGGIMR
ncbi:hypothetical protein RINTHM_14060 [Richelia intracellularis HM01]|nr:hypothetical protein RINTHM_14060 [Richelia intracellularis HM01]